MKRRIVYLAILLGISLNGYTQETSTETITRQAIVFKPINFSNIDLSQHSDGFQGYQIGVAYERLFQPNSHWAWVLPITSTLYHTIIIVDYQKDGYGLYFSPGIKYYLKPGQPKSGWSADVNALLGRNTFHYSSSTSKGDIQEKYYGLLCNWLYNAPIGETTFLNFEIGLGIKNTHKNNNMSSLDAGAMTWQPQHLTSTYFSGILNISIEISKWF